MMQSKVDESFPKKNGVKIRTSPPKVIIATQWPDNIVVLDLSARNIQSLDENVKLPPKLLNLNLSQNSLTRVPDAVLNLETLKNFDISYNEIKFFDDTPNFYNCIEKLNLSNNKLRGPPYWVWSESTSKLTELDLSNNHMITSAFKELQIYYEELLEYTTSVTNIKLYNCNLGSYIELVKTFSKAKVIELGTSDLSQLISSNFLEHVPCRGLTQCCDIESLNISNTHIYTVDSKIDIYKNLKEINLSQNSISHLPNEFCNLVNLETCVLSCNNILYLPDDIVQLKKLVCLRLDSNELCTFPCNLAELKNLKVLDLYDNCLYDVPEGIRHIEELDFAFNYFDEPTDMIYLEKKEKLRLNFKDRLDKRKEQVSRPESIESSDTAEDEELVEYMNNLNCNKETAEPEIRPPSSPEDWDSDEYWVPGYYRSNSPCLRTSWIHFVEQKMRDGHFCPMDIHPIPVTEQVKYERLCNPKVWREVEGQFDDCSDDNS